MNEIETIKKKYYGFQYGWINPVGEFLPKGTEIMYDAQLFFLKKYFGGGGKVLDIGTGGGFLDDYLLKLGAKDIETIEINETLYEAARQKYNNIQEIRPLYGDIMSFEFKSNYDLIIAFDVIEHFPLDQGVSMLKKIYSLLNKGGMCIIRTENMANIFVGTYSRYNDITHATGFAEYSLQMAFMSAGFSDFTVVSPRFKRFSKLWIMHKINSFLQKKIIEMQNKPIPRSIYKDLLCYGIKK